MREVTVVPGAKAAVAALIHAARRVGVVTPHWQGYVVAAELFGRGIKFLEAGPEARWLPRFECLSGVDTLIVNYPNNPTGAVLTEPTLRELLDVAEGEGITLVSDETYRDVVFEGNPLVMIDRRFEGTVSIYSFSKTFSLPGLRVGYVVGDPRLVDVVARFVAATYTSVPVFAQLAALKALEVRDEVIKVVKGTYSRRAKAFCNALSRKRFDFIEPGGAIYVFVKVRTGVDGVELTRRLLREGVAVFPGVAFGERFKDYVRVSLTAPEDVLTQVAKLMGEVAEP